MLKAGTKLQDRYQIERLIAAGGMGAVYMARDLRLNAVVALKQFLLAKSGVSDLFIREARLLANLRHPALVVVSDYRDGD